MIGRTIADSKGKWLRFVHIVEQIDKASLYLNDTGVASLSQFASQVVLIPIPGGTISRGKGAGEVEPFTFLVSPHVAPLGHPPGVDAQHFHLIAPYTKDARQWSKLRWTDVYSGEPYAITTRDVVSGEGIARVQSYRGVIARYRVHSEAKSLGPDGLPCGKRTVGLLERRPVVLGELVHFGKETNRLEEVEQGLVHDWDEVQLVFREPQDRRRDSTFRHDSKEQRTCGACGTALGSPRAMYCSSPCRQRAYRQRKWHATSA